MTIKELMEKAGKARADAEAIMNKASAEKREMTAEENAAFDRAMDERDAFKKQADELQHAADRRGRMAKAQDEDRQVQSRRTQDDPPGRRGDRDEDRANQPVTMEFRGRTVEFRPGTDYHRRCQAGYRQEFSAVLAGEKRVLQSELDVDGGYLIAPPIFNLEVLRDLDNETFVRKYARKFMLDPGRKMTTPKRTAKANTFAWGGELTTPTADSSMKFGRKTLDPKYMSGLVLVSRDLLQSAAISVDAIVREEIAINAGELEEQAFMTGNGANQPLGVFTATDDGIGTARDVSTGNTTTAITFDGLIECLHSLKLKYRASAGLAWFFSAAAVKMIRKLKDGNGQYLWQQSVAAGMPDRILNVPYVESEWVPSTFTTGQYVGIIGDWTKYWIADCNQVELQVLIEQYALDNENGYLARRKVDAAPALAEAFARVKLA